MCGGAHSHEKLLRKKFAGALYFFSFKEPLSGKGSIFFSRMGPLLILSSLSLAIVSWLFWAKALTLARIYDEEQSGAQSVRPNS